MNKEFFKTIKDDKSLNRFDLVHDKIVGIINNGDIDDGEIISIMKHYNHQDTDRGIIRTILMTLKPIKSQHKKISELYDDLANILRLSNKQI